jgi:hypothetical protein
MLQPLPKPGIGGVKILPREAKRPGNMAHSVEELRSGIEDQSLPCRHQGLKLPQVKVRTLDHGRGRNIDERQRMGP